MTKSELYQNSPAMCEQLIDDVAKEQLQSIDAQTDSDAEFVKNTMTGVFNDNEFKRVTIHDAAERATMATENYQQTRGTTMPSEPDYRRGGYLNCCGESHSS